jgi:hypothetical protein
VTAISTECTSIIRTSARRLAIGLSAPAEYDQYFMPRTGIMLPRQLPYQKWIAIGRQLAAINTSSAWCLGDWLIYGEDAYSGRYRDAIEQTSLDYQTLRNYAWVARRFPMSRRRDTLSFAHHAEVAGLPEHEQDFWLRKAEEHSWSRNRLRQEVRGSLAERATADEPDENRAGPDGVQEESQGNAGDALDAGNHAHSPSGKAMTASAADADGFRIAVHLSPEQVESCQAAAVRLGQSIEEWVACTLDRAAREELDRKNR